MIEGCSMGRHYLSSLYYLHSLFTHDSFYEYVSQMMLCITQWPTKSHLISSLPNSFPVYVPSWSQSSSLAIHVTTPEIKSAQVCVTTVLSPRSFLRDNQFCFFFTFSMPSLLHESIYLKSHSDPFDRLEVVLLTATYFDLMSTHSCLWFICIANLILWKCFSTGCARTAQPVTN